MGSPRIARFVSWCLAIAVHELLFILALGIEKEEVQLILWKPDVYSAMVAQVPSDRPDLAETAPVWAGRWPIDCNHQELLQIPSDQIVADTRCKVCQWPWWVIRAAMQN